MEWGEGDREWEVDGWWWCLGRGFMGGGVEVEWG